MVVVISTGGCFSVFGAEGRDGVSGCFVKRSVGGVAFQEGVVRRIAFWGEWHFLWDAVQLGARGGRLHRLD